MLAWVSHISYSQSAFIELVEKAFGADQQLVNGIQSSNHFGLIEGHPYLMDENFQEGCLQVGNITYEGVRIRFNLYTQRPEVEYRTTEGNLNQFMAVPERISGFMLGEIQFMRLELEGGSPAYFQVISVGEDSCYVAWKKQLGSSTSSGSGYRFNPPEVLCILRVNQHSLVFHDRKTLVTAFPEHIRKSVKKMVKEEKFSFREATPPGYEQFAENLIRLYREGMVP